MAESEQAPTQDTPSPEAPAVDSGARKYADKYESVEELEKAHLELQRTRTQDRMEFSELKQKLDRVDSNLEQFAYGQTQRQAYVPVAPQDPQERNQQVLTRFYADPEGTLREIEERAVTRVREETRINADLVGRIQKWQSDNPDLAAYPEIVTYCVGQTDGRKNALDRLHDATPKIRARILELRTPRTEGSGATPQPGDRIEAPGSGGRPITQQAQPAQRTSQEQELKNYIAERVALSRPTPPKHS